MGAARPPMPAGEKGTAPSFVVWAVKDPTSANLDRIQVIKGWTKDGQSFAKIYDVAWKPYAANQINFIEAVDRGSQPLKSFMLKQTRQEDLALFVKLSHSPALQSPDQTPMKLLVPAFVISELKTAFQIGFIIFIPFVIIDMVVASVLMSMGMMMLSPMLVSLPFKLMLFVLADGWTLLIASLVQTYQT